MRKQNCMRLLPEATCGMSLERTKTELTTEYVPQLAVRGQHCHQAAQQAALRVRDAAMVGCCLTSGLLSGVRERRQPAKYKRLQEHLRQCLQGEVV